MARKRTYQLKVGDVVAIAGEPCVVVKHDVPRAVGRSELTLVGRSLSGNPADATRAYALRFRNRVRLVPKLDRSWYVFGSAHRDTVASAYDNVRTGCDDIAALEQMENMILAAERIYDAKINAPK